ncbi:MCM2 3 5 family protein [Rutstroemia sp. NJR-2017a BBW]|nr:MCM2 3 5 family protein [Rutstroemia sp. NJR-2017a BBW]
MTTDPVDGKRNSLPEGDVNLPDEPTPIAISPSKSLLTSTHQRHGYRRMDSQGSLQLPPDVQPSLSDSHSTIPSIMQDDASDSATVTQGLGISRMSSTRGRKSPTPPNPASALQSPTLGSLATSPATSQRPLFSPAWTQDTYYEGLDQGHSRNESVEEADISRGKISAFTESLDAAFESVEDFTKLKDLKVAGGHNADGIWFFIGVIRPRFGIIRTGGSLNPSTASIIFAIFAKTIELSFVTIFVTFLGQVLSRRSLVKTSSGITVAELTMRTWVIQPGFMITNPKVLRTAGLSFLGAITLTAAVVAMFYTTASDALVNPSLQLGHWHYKNMSGFVQSSFGNINFVMQSCQTPIHASADPEYSASTCVSLDDAGESYHNFLEYSRTWAAINSPGGKGKGNSSKLAERPNVTAMLYDNTTVTGAWVDTEYSDIAANYQKYNRIINNVTMAMPHSGVIAAASDHVNNILQPSDLDGVGEYRVRASVVSPAINVLCANMNASELSPLIYVDWPNAKTNSSDFPGQRTAWSGWDDEVQLQPGEDYLNSTVVDEIFGWGTVKNGLKNQPPVFPMVYRSPPLSATEANCCSCRLTSI